MAEKMVDLKRSKKEKKAAEQPGKIGGDDYHYGLHVSLGDEELEKLGIHTLPKVGSKMHMHAHAHVTSVSQNASEGGETNRRVELQLRKMHLGEPPAGEDLERETDDGDEEKVSGAKAAMDRVLPKKM